MLPSKPGVYLIEVAGLAYVGSSFSMMKRQRAHLTKLEARKHVNRQLQRLFNLHGAKSLKFTVIEAFTRDVSRARFRDSERDYTTYYASKKELLNGALGSVKAFQSSTRLTDSATV